MTPATDAAVIGGGVVGLAVAAALANAGRSVVLLEQHGRLASETSARNSGVVHAGLYYANGSKKARLCLRGRELLYARCRARGIPHRRTGKLVVACEPAELAALEALHENALRNGATGLTPWDAARLRREEPLLRGVAALRSRESGIVDAHALAESLADEARERGAILALRHRFVGVEPSPRGYRLRLEGPDGASELRAEAVVNAAGLHADVVSAAFGLDVDRLGLRLAPNKGDYFVLHPRAPRPTCPLVYPLPQGAGLGVHLTSDLAGTLRAGPDATWVDALRYEVDAAKGPAFAAAVRRYLPGLADEHLTPDYAGIRPKLARGNGLGADFVLEECSAQGLPGFVQLVGIESPGLTAALAIAEEVARCLGAVT